MILNLALYIYAKIFSLAGHNTQSAFERKKPRELKVFNLTTKNYANQYLIQWVPPTTGFLKKKCVLLIIGQNPQFLKFLAET